MWHQQQLGKMYYHNLSHECHFYACVCASSCACEFGTWVCVCQSNLDQQMLWWQYHQSIVTRASAGAGLIPATATRACAATRLTVTKESQDLGSFCVGAQPIKGHVIVMSSLTGWANTQDNPCRILSNLSFSQFIIYMINEARVILFHAT